MSSCDKAGRHTAFPLPDSTVAEEIITVHHSQLIKKELYGAFTPPFLWTFTLQRAHTHTHNVKCQCVISVTEET